MDHELTGWEEHVRDEAWECGEIAALRRESEEMARMENAGLEFENEEFRRLRGFACSPCGPSCSRGLLAAECRPDDLPF